MNAREHPWTQHQKKLVETHGVFWVKLKSLGAVTVQIESKLCLQIF
jgi:hypothetical protein